MTTWTTLLKWVGIESPRPVAGPARSTTVAATEQGILHVPGEYRALYTYLAHRHASVVVLTFEQIDSLLGFALPMPARSEREWWTDPVGSQRHSAAWTAAGRTAAPSLAAGIIAFERPV